MFSCVLDTLILFHIFNLLLFVAHHSMMTTEREGDHPDPNAPMASEQQVRNNSTATLVSIGNKNGLSFYLFKHENAELSDEITAHLFSDDDMDDDDELDEHNDLETIEEQTVNTSDDDDDDDDDNRV